VECRLSFYLTGADCQPCRIRGIFERRNRIGERMRVRLRDRIVHIYTDSLVQDSSAI
jgi:hypothetical protein